MDLTLEKHLTQMIELYSGEDFRETLLLAKKDYMELTGTLSDEDQGFESRMNCFNDWYLFNYLYQDKHTFAEYYSSTHELSEDLESALKEVHYSIFQYAKDSMKKKMILKDLLYGKKVTIDDNSDAGVVINDIFIGRMITYRGKSYILSGLSIVPTSVKNAIKKESRKVKRQGNPDAELSFLYKIENLSIKALRYIHIDPEKIFVF